MDKITDPIVQYLISFGVVLFLFSTVCMMISFFRAKKAQISFFEHINKNTDFIKFMSWVAVILLICGSFFGIMQIVHNIMFQYDKKIKTSK